MSRRWTAHFGGVVVCTTLVAGAYGQAGNQRPSLSDRMAALRRGWLQNEDEQPQQEPERGGAASLLPSWLGGADDEQPPTHTRHPNTRAARTLREGSQAQRQAAIQHDARSPRMAERSGTGSRSASSANSNRPLLPGLGGSPFPSNDARVGDQYGPSTSANPADVISDFQSIDAADGNGRARSSSATQTRNGSVRPSPGRKSPVGRTNTPQFDTEDVRRELSGSFSGSMTRSGTITTREVDQPASNVDSSEERALTLTPEVSNAPITTPSQQANRGSEFGSQESGMATTPLTERAPAVSAEQAAEAFDSEADEKSSFGFSGFVRTPQSVSSSRNRPGAQQRGFGEALQVANGGDPSVLVSNRTPVITSDIRGPKQILIGREAVYRVRLQNRGDVAAEGVVATVRIPSWADVVDTAASIGAVQPSQNPSMPSQVEWHLEHLDPRAIETLDIRLIPRESRPLELGISWTLAPVGSRAIVEVQEPKLDVQVTGPSEVLYDNAQTFRLTLANPGTGPASNVKIELVPPGATREAATSHTIGELLPGETKSVELELTAREAGKLLVQAIATADGGLNAEVSKEIFCRKPELELDWRGPATKYAGTTATFFFRVRNPGTASAENVAVQVKLPQGAQFVSASEGQVYDDEKREVQWRLGTLKPGDDSYMELKCIVNSAGANQLQVRATDASGSLTDSATAETNVVALADLKLEVSDPRGPVAVGSAAMYEIRVKNRGSSAARDVNVVALFSEGIEPDQAEGAMFTVSDGRVSFRPIEEIPAGREVTLQIRAHAVEPGTHVFRAEVLCRDSEIKLAAEETTMFYTDEVMPSTDSAQQPTTGSRYDTSVR